MAKNGSDSHIISLILYPDSDSWNSSNQINRIWDAYKDSADICYILHDKDISANEWKSQELKAHYHMFIRFRGNRSIDKFQRDFKISRSCIFDINAFRHEFMLNPAISQEMIYKSWEDCVRYCCHRTPDTKSKYQYPLSDLHANFDYSKYFLEMKSPDPADIVALRIKRWAIKNHANADQVLEYVCRNGYFSQYQRCYRMISDILSGYRWWSIYDDFQIVDFDDDDKAKFPI